MKLTKFKEKNHKKIGIILFSICCILLVTIVFLYKSFAIFETNENKNIIRGNVEDMGDLYFSFYLDNDIQRKMPTKGSGVVFDNEKSYCEVQSQKDPSITLDFDLETWSVITTGLKDNHTKCNLYFKKTYNNTTLYDLSPNQFHGKFMNGAEVIEDEDGMKAIYFDGIDDFVDIADIPETIPFEDGFTIEFTATWKNSYYWSRIFEFGNGINADNLFVANYYEENKLAIGTRYEKFTDFQNISTPPVEIVLNKKESFKLIESKKENTVTVDMYKNDIFIGSTLFDVSKTGNIIRNVTRKENYLGKSSWIGASYSDHYFHGLIYNLKITDAKNNVILWYYL